MDSQSLHHLELRKPDGRSLWLYARTPITGVSQAPCPNREPVVVRSRLRWHPLRGEWVAYAGHRQNRTFLPPAEYNPLLPTKSPECPTEIPEGNYDVAVFENLFPTFSPNALEPGETFDGNQRGEQGAYGKCEVVVFSRDPTGSLGSLPLPHLELILEVWAKRTREITKNPGIRYVMPFENRGVEMGVTLHHPHGQIYAYPMVPPVPERENEQQRLHFETKNGRGLLEEMIHTELRDQRRIIAQAKTAIAFVPACARYPYEVWVMPLRPVQLLDELDSKERADLARVLKTVLLKYDGLWKKSMPYLLAVHQAPVNSGPHPWFHLHFELTPPLRARDKLKYLAGTELAAGLFANDCLPEQTAEELSAVVVES